MWDRSVMEYGHLKGPQEHRAGRGAVQRRRTVAALWLAAGLVCSGVGASAQDMPEFPSGVWMKPGGKAAVELFTCEGDRLCGRLMWANPKVYPDGQTRDIRNPDAELSKRDLCGATIIWGLERDGPRVWEDGWVYDPSTGRTYRAKLTVKGPETLRVRGFKFISLLGKSQEWQPAPPEVMDELCTAPLAGRWPAGKMADQPSGDRQGL